MAAFANRFRLRPNDPTSLARQLEVDFGAGSSPGITHPGTAATSGVTQETPQSHLPEVSGLANGDVQPSGEVPQTTLSNATAEGVPITVGVPVDTPLVSQSETGTSPVEFAPGGSLYQRAAQGANKNARLYIRDPVGIRTLTESEAFKLQGIPTTRLGALMREVSINKILKAVGNSVSPKVVAIVAACLLG
eukprot:jgi/Mesvir1/4633/Mv03683-RA.1